MKVVKPLVVQPPQLQLNCRFLLSVNLEGQWCFFLLDQLRQTIGRSANSSIRIKQGGVSRYHAVLVRHQNQFKLIDGDGRGQPSGNGTFVNGQRVQSCWIQPGDIIHLGSEAVKAQIDQISLDQHEIERFEQRLRSQARLLDTADSERPTALHMIPTATECNEL